jgi:DNA-binding NtrC family response regulator
VVIRVAMVEDHPIVQAGLSRILAAAPNVRLVETARTIEELHSPSKEVDVLLLDLHLPGRLQGLGGVRHMTDRGFRVLIVTGEDTSTRLSIWTRSVPSRLVAATSVRGWRRSPAAPTSSWRPPTPTS